MRLRKARPPGFEEKYARLLKSYLPTYATEVLRGPSEYGGKFLLGPHHIEWGDAVVNHRRNLILAARDHGKSHFFCFGYPLWMADRVAPGRIGYIMSATEQQAIEHLDKIRLECIGGGENGGPNPKLQHLLTGQKRKPFLKDSAKTLKFANGSEIRARGFGTRVRGGHPWWLVGDDMLNDEHLWSEMVRKKGLDYFLSAVAPMIVPGGQMVVVGTPFHAQDLYAHLEDTGVYHTLKFPAVNPKGDALWPARYDEKALDQKRKELKSEIRWSREFLCRPISDESSLFPSALFERPGILQPYALGLPGSYWRGLGFDVYIGVDLAMSASTRADWFVIFVQAVDPKTGDRYVVDIIRRRGLGFQEQVNTIIQASKKYEPVYVFVEANQYQRVVSEEVIRTSDAPIKAFYTRGRYTKQVSTARRGMTGAINSANKYALDQGIPALRMLLENGKWKIPWAESTRETVKVWMTEMQSFGWQEGKLTGVGAHDDTVDACWICERAIQAGGSFASGVGLVDPDLNMEPGSLAAEVEESDIDFFGVGGQDWRPDETAGSFIPNREQGGPGW